jgi:hypothetical protein
MVKLVLCIQPFVFLGGDSDIPFNMDLDPCVQSLQAQLFSNILPVYLLTMSLALYFHTVWGRILKEFQETNLKNPNSPW